MKNFKKQKHKIKYIFFTLFFLIMKMKFSKYILNKEFK